MARRPRVQYPGAIYHVMSRGDRRKAIFRDDQDRRSFVGTLGEACAKTGWEVHAYVIMPNHFHLVMETPQANLVAGMKWLLGTWTMRFKRRHRLTGHLFAGRYRSLLVDGSSPGYLKTVCDYVHLNPVRARLLRAAEPVRIYPWSSWPAYLQAPSRRPGWLRVDRLFGEYRIARDSLAGRRQLQRALEERRSAEEGREFSRVRRGWCLGDEGFRKELLAQMGKPRGPAHYGEERAESEVEKAERVIARELKRRGCSEEELLLRRKGDPRKVKLAQRLRAETVQSVQWIAQRLSMGSPAYVNHLLWRAGKSINNRK